MIPTNGPIVFVEQHPDDAHATSGGLAAEADEMGVEFYVVCFTRGELGWHTGLTRRQIAGVRSGRLRAREQRRADRILGIRRTIFVRGYRDGGLSDVSPQRGVETLAPILQDLNPGIVISWDHTGFFGHPDHCWGAKVTAQALSQSGLAGTRLWYVAFTPRARRLIPARAFVDGRPPEPYTGKLALRYQLPPHIRERKRRALGTHRTQARSLADLDEWGGVEEFYDAAA